MPFIPCSSAIERLAGPGLGTACPAAAPAGLPGAGSGGESAIRSVGPPPGRPGPPLRSTPCGSDMSAVRHAWGSSRARCGVGMLWAVGWLGLQGLLAPHGWSRVRGRAPGQWAGRLYCLLHTATGFMHLRTCGREHALAFQDVGVSRLHGDDKGVFADSRPGRVSLSRARWGSQHRVQTPQWPLAPAVPPGCSRPAPAGSHLGGLSWWSWLLDLGSRVSRQHSGRPSPAGQHAGSPTPG